LRISASSSDTGFLKLQLQAPIFTGSTPLHFAAGEPTVEHAVAAELRATATADLTKADFNDISAPGCIKARG
jgi:hypothetical protein